MLFLCGIVEPRGTRDLATDLSLMAGARRAAQGRAPSTVGLPGAALLHANGTLSQANAGAATVLVYRPSAEELDGDLASARALAETWQRTRSFDCGALRGAFVAVLYDAEAGELRLAVDRFATCPLYYHASETRLAFAVDLDALAALPGVPREIDPQAIYDYVFYHCIPAPRAIYRDVAKLAPAAMLSWQGGAASQASYWTPGFARDGRDADTLAAELRARLETAVRRRARPGCGAFLSGGLDSSTVAGMLKRVAGRAPTFTIGFDAADYDESGFARIAAEHFATEHHEYFVTPADIRDSLPRIAAHYAEPFGNSSVLPTYHCARFAREHGIDLLLAGDGGDELFAGNTRYVEQRLFERYFNVPAPARWLLETGYRLLPFITALPVAARGQSYIRHARMGLPDRLQAYNFLHRFDPAGVFEGEWLAHIDREAPWRGWRERYSAPAAGSALQRMLHLDWKFTLADNDLVKVTRMCDLAGVEVAYPMLDDDLVFLAEGLDEARLLPGGELRGFYKHALAGVLPEAILKKSKHGFGLPFGMWLRTDEDLKAMAHDALSGLATRGIFLPGFIEQAERLNRESDAAGYYGELVWIMMMLELWLREHA